MAGEKVTMMYFKAIFLSYVQRNWEGEKRKKGRKKNPCHDKALLCHLPE
jgi:hypothetical protein